MPDSPANPARILVAGDMHGHWAESDRRFVESFAAELTLFVGDLGDEDVEMVRAVAEIDAPKAVILGNHDAWQSFSQRRPTDRLRESLATLADDHLGYGIRELPEAGLTLVGARPFSWGGQDLRSPELYGELYGVRTLRMSAQKIVDLAARAEHRDLLILAHNGPTGLSDSPGDIYGKDFGRRPGGDWGDQDLALAIERIRGLPVRLRAVIAGHMHDRLASPRGGRRTRFVRRDGIAFLNPAVVPRVRRLDDGTELRHFLSTEWHGGRLLRAAELWVDCDGTVRSNESVEFVELPDSERPGTAVGS